jgi:hypothetical protein
MAGRPTSFARYLSVSALGDDFLRGFREVEANLNREVIAIKDRTSKGLLLAVAFIRNDTETTPYITPMESGNLRSSWFAATAERIVDKDKYSRSFRDDPGRGLKGSQLALDHSAAITEAKGLMSSAKTGGVIGTMFGYSAGYAAYAHENIDAEFKRPGSGPKWFEAALKRNSGTVLKIISDNVRIKR